MLDYADFVRMNNGWATKAQYMMCTICFKTFLF